MLKTKKTLRIENLENVEIKKTLRIENQENVENKELKKC